MRAAELLGNDAGNLARLDEAELVAMTQKAHWLVQRALHQLHKLECIVAELGRWALTGGGHLRAVVARIDEAFEVLLQAFIDHASQQIPARL